MLRHIVKKEILDTIINAKFVFTFVVCTILILLSVYAGVGGYILEKREYSASVASAKRNLEAKPDYESLAGIGIRVSRAPIALGAVVSGIEEAVGRVAPVNVTSDPSLIDSKYDDSPIFAVFGSLDLMFIVKVVLSLFAILFTYNIIAGEKEKGTLKLALSNGIARDQFLLGKAIGSYISLLVPLFFSLLLGLLIIIASPDLALSQDDWVRLILILALFFLYLSVFISLGLFVSSRTASSSTSFLVLLFVWVIFVMVIPKLAVLIAAQVQPTPSIQEVTAKKDAYLQQLQQEQMKGFQDWVMQEASREAKDPKGSQSRLLKFLEEQKKDMTARLETYNAIVNRDYQMKKLAQEKLAANISRISPASDLTFGSMSLAKTGIDEYERFLASVRAYKVIYSRWLNSKIGQSINLQTQKAAKIALTDMPQHEFASEPVSKSLLRAIPDFIFMIVMIIGFFFGAYASFRRYDVR